MRYLILLLLVVTLGVNVYVWSITFENSPFSPINLNPSPEVILNRSPSSNTTQISTINNCDTFQSRFAVTTDELKNYINAQPESAQVVKGYRNLYGTITAILAKDNFPINFQLDDQGKITQISCAFTQVARDNTTDIDFVIPENDFARIVRYRETLDANQAPVYLQNLTTKPIDAKNTILERLKEL